MWCDFWWCCKGLKCSLYLTPVALAIVLLQSEHKTLPLQHHRFSQLSYKQSIWLQTCWSTNTGQWEFWRAPVTTHHKRPSCLHTVWNHSKKPALELWHSAVHDNNILTLIGNMWCQQCLAGFKYMQSWGDPRCHFVCMCICMCVCVDLGYVVEGAVESNMRQG